MTEYLWKKWNNLSIGSKISLSFGVVLLIVILEFSIGTTGLIRIQKVDDTILSAATSQRLVLTVSRNWERVKRFSALFFLQYPELGPDRSFSMFALPAGSSIDEIIRDMVQLKQTAEQAEASHFLSRNIGLINRILDNTDLYLQGFKQGSALVRQSAVDGNGKSLARVIKEKEDTLKNLDQDIEAEIAALLASFQEEVRNAEQRISDIRHQTTLMFVAMIILSILAIIFISLILRQSITRKIVGLTRAAETLEEGDLSIVLPVSSNDELGRLYGTFNTMAGKLQKIFTRLTVLHQASYNVSDNLDEQHVIEVSLEAVQKICSPEFACIWLLENGTPVVKGCRGDSGRGEKRSPFLDFQDDSIPLDARCWESEVRNVVNETDTSAEAVIPLVLGDRFLGVLHIQSGKQDFFSKDVVEILELLSAHTALGITNSRRFDEKDRQARIDLLTGLNNRRGMYEYGTRDIQRCLRLGRPVSAIFMDIDFFKQFNDRYSYETGDLVLQRVSAVFKESMRSIDILSRFGGEEFVAILPELELKDAVEVAERLRRTINEQKIYSDFGELSITVSLGVAAAGETSGDFPGTDAAVYLDKLLAEAGLLLHKAKENGRNRVESGIE